MDATREDPLFAFIVAPLCTSSAFQVFASSFLQVTWWKMGPPAKHDFTCWGSCYTIPIHIPEDGIRIGSPWRLEDDLRGFCYTKETYSTEHEVEVSHVEREN